MPLLEPTGATGLAGRWAALWRRSAPAAQPEEVRAVLDRLAGCYAAPGRHYHTLGHVQQCLEELDEARHLAARPDLVEAALWFHDSIYDPRRSDNEAQSAAFASEALARFGLPPDEIDTVKRLILVTRHATGPGDGLTGDEGLIADVDLAILGQPATIFDDYEVAIRREYAHVPAETYRAGRAAVLRGFLDRHSIYATPHFQRHYEQQARENLARSLARLELLHERDRRPRLVAELAKLDPEEERALADEALTADAPWPSRGERSVPPIL